MDPRQPKVAYDDSEEHWFAAQTHQVFDTHQPDWVAGGDALRETQLTWNDGSGTFWQDARNFGLLRLVTNDGSVCDTP